MSFLDISSPAQNEHRFSLSTAKLDEEIKAKHLQNVRETLLKIYRGLSYPTLNEKDSLAVQSANASTAFGELTPNGVTKMCDPEHLDALGATVCYDLGMGLGRLIIQIFLQFPNLKKVVGVELCPSRAAVAFTALRELSKDDRFRYEENMDGTRLRIIEKSSEAKESKTAKKEEKKEAAKHPWTENLPSTTRYLELRCCNLFTCKDALEDGHIIVLETAFPSTMYSKVADFLSQFRKGTRIMGYHSLENFYSYRPDGLVQQSTTKMPWTPLDCDPYCEASFGANFYFYRKD